MADLKSNHLTNAQIADYVDGLLTPGDAREIEEHLRGCAICRAEVHARRRLRRSIQRGLSRQHRLYRLTDTGPLHIG